MAAFWDNNDVLELALLAWVIAVVAKDLFFAAPWPKRWAHYTYEATRPFRPAITAADILDAQQLVDCRRCLPKYKYLLSVVAAGLLVALNLYRFAFESVLSRGIGEGVRLVPLGHALAWLYICARIARLKSVTPNYSALVASLLEVGQVGYLYIATEPVNGPLHLATVLCSATIIFVGLSQPVEEFIVTPNIASIKVEFVSEQYTYPEDGCTLWQTLSFTWYRPLLTLGSTKSLKPKDIWSNSPFLDAERLHRLFKHKPENSLIWALVKYNGLDLILDGGLQIIANMLKLSPALLTKAILEAIGSSDRSVRLGALKYSVLALVIGLATALLDVLHAYFADRAGLRMRAQIMSSLHEKSLRRKDMQGAVDTIASKDSKKKDTNDTDMGDASVGRVVNLMSGDTAQIASACTWILYCLEIPIQFTVAMAFLFKVMGPSAAFGLIVLAVTIPANHFLVKQSKAARKAWKDAQDARVNEVNTLIRSIRFIKGNDWQDRWVERVLALRKKEVRLLNVTRVQSLVLGFVWMLSPGFVVVVSFWAYSNIYKNTVTIPMAFTAISLFGNLSGPLSSIPTVVIYILQAVVSAKRISNFLAEPEVEDRACALKRQPDAKTPSDSKLVSIQGVYKWFKRSVGTEEEKAPSRRFFGIFKGKKAAAADETDELKGSDDANLAMAQFELHIEDEVIFPEGLTLLGGPTGAGKSSLLAALLGEMDLISGKISLDKNLANVAYMASVPFLEGATIKNNILFSEPYDETRYNATLEACALRPDLELWDLGDETKIGERGISLSGGQKARIGLAKVVYARSRVVLLDDVLAAVDTHTARHLVKYCFNGHLMEGRVVILATHHLDICQSSAKLILHMDEGRIASREILTPAQEVHQVPSLPYTAPKPSEDKPVASLDEEEEVIQGAVKLRVFGRYLKAIGLKIWTILMLVQVCSRLMSFGEDWLLKTWGESNQARSTAALFHIATEYLSPTTYLAFYQTQLLSFDWPTQEEGAAPWLRLYLYFYIAATIGSILSTAVVYVGATIAAQRLFKDLLHSIVHATMRWHDKTPTGRVLNRFGDDFNKIDGSVAMSFRYALSCLLSILFNAVVVSVILPPFALPFLGLLVLVWVASRPYVATSRSLRRIDSNSRSPIYTGFGEVLHGISTIRAFAAEARYQERFYSKVNAMLKLTWAYYMARRWIRLRFDLLSTIINATTFALVVVSNVPQGLAAIAIVWSQYMVMYCMELVQMATMLEQDLNSVERVDSYINLEEQERPSVIEGHRPPLSWPSRDSPLYVEDLHVRYHETLPDVLRGITFELKPREKVALVGRTGSGKSTFSLALLRFIEARQGSIVIDGIDISTIGLSDLRKNIAVMSQDAVLFQGTLRENLDPFDEFDDNELWDVLFRCQMAGSSVPPTAAPSRTASSANLLGQSNTAPGSPTSSSAPTLVEKRQQIRSLDQPVSEMGNNFSSGQRQLLALARCLLRRPKILLMDEASSSIDKATDTLIQQFIRDAFADAMIAHRLATIIEVDRVLVLDKGQVAQFASPKELLASREGLFYQLCCESADKQHLFKSVGLEVPQ